MDQIEYFIKSAIEITDLKIERKPSRELSLVKTKLQEALMWYRS